MAGESGRRGIGKDVLNAILPTYIAVFFYTQKDAAEESDRIYFHFFCRLRDSNHRTGDQSTATLLGSDKWDVQPGLAKL